MLNSFRQFTENFFWYFNLVIKFTKLRPQCTVILVLLNTFTQVLMLASFLLPLKMIFSLSVGTFEPLFIGIYFIDTKNELAIIYGIIIFLIVFFYIIFEKLDSKYKLKCSKNICKNENRIQVFPDQDELAKTIYTIYFKSLSNLCLFILILSILLLVYPLLGFVLVFYWLAILVISLFLFDINKEFRDSINDGIGSLLGKFSMFSFLIIFIIVVNDILSVNPSVSAIFAIIGLILIRQIMSNLIHSLISINSLLNHKENLLIIFFKKQINTINRVRKIDIKFIELFNNNYHHVWIPKILNKILENNDEIKHISWFELAIPNEYAFEVNTINQNYLIKIFNKNLTAKAMNEIKLLEKGELINFTLQFLGSEKIDGFICSLFSLPNNYKTFETNKEFMEKRLDFLRDINYEDVSKDLLNQYSNSHVFINKRITSKTLEKLIISVNKDEMEIIEQFKEKLNLLSHYIESLPLRFNVKKITYINCITIDEKIKILSFGDWTIEPLGFSLSLKNKEYEILKEISNEELEIPIKLVLKLKEFEQNFGRHSYKMALVVLKDILELLKTID